MARTLYTTAFCPWCERVRAALDRMQLPYEEVTVSGNRKLRDDVQRISGQRQVPVLVDGDTVVHESSRILAHLKQNYPR